MNARPRFIQREQSHNGCHILVDLWRVELHTAHCKCTNHSHGKPKFCSDSDCSACVSEPVWADLNAEASPFPCLPAHVPLNHVYDPSLAESCHQSARSTGFFGSFRRSFTAQEASFLRLSWDRARQYVSFFILTHGATERTRTFTPFRTSTSSLRVYQFRHGRMCFASLRESAFSLSRLGVCTTSSGVSWWMWKDSNLLSLIGIATRLQRAYLSWECTSVKPGGQKTMSS
jgi:hypothetical protein